MHLSPDGLAARHARYVSGTQAFGVVLACNGFWYSGEHPMGTHALDVSKGTQMVGMPTWEEMAQAVDAQEGIIECMIELVSCMGQLGLAISTDGMCADVPERLSNVDDRLAMMKAVLFPSGG